MPQINPAEDSEGSELREPVQASVRSAGTEEQAVRSAGTEEPAVRPAGTEEQAVRPAGTEEQAVRPAEPLTDQLKPMTDEEPWALLEPSAALAAWEPLPFLVSG